MMNMERDWSSIVVTIQYKFNGFHSLRSIICVNALRFSSPRLQLSFRNTLVRVYQVTNSSWIRLLEIWALNKVSPVFDSVRFSVSFGVKNY